MLFLYVYMQGNLEYYNKLIVVIYKLVPNKDGLFWHCFGPTTLERRCAN